MDYRASHPARPCEREWVSELNPKLSGGFHPSVALTVRLNRLLCPHRRCDAIALKSAMRGTEATGLTDGENIPDIPGCARGRPHESKR